MLLRKYIKVRRICWNVVSNLKQLWSSALLLQIMSRLYIAPIYFVKLLQIQVACCPSVLKCRWKSNPKMLISLVTAGYKFSLHLLIFVAIVILCFVLSGCTTTQRTFRDVGLINFRFNETTNDTQLSLKNETLASSTVLVGYVGVCLEIGGQYTCSTTSKWTELETYYQNSFSLSSTSVNLLQLGKTFNDLCHPSFLFVTILFSIILFFSSFWTIGEKLPAHGKVKLINCGVCSLNVLIWGLGAMLQQEAVNSAVSLVKSASDTTILAKMGTRCCRMS